MVNADDFDVFLEREKYPTKEAVEFIRKPNWT